MGAGVAGRPPLGAKDREVRPEFGVFESDPSAFLMGTVPVYIDPDDPRRDLGDTSALPAMGSVPDPK